MILTFLQQIFISTFSIPGTLLGTGNKRVGGEGIERKSLPCPLYFRLRVQFSTVQSLSPFWLFETPWTAAHQASPSLTISWSLPKFISIESVMPSTLLILCHPLLLLPSVFPSIRVFSNELAVHVRWPKIGVSDSVLKNRNITLLTKVHIVKAMVFPSVMYVYESWIMTKAEHWRIDAFELWCWRRLFRVSWTARRQTSQS